MDSPLPTPSSGGIELGTLGGATSAAYEINACRQFADATPRTTSHRPVTRGRSQSLKASQNERRCVLPIPAQWCIIPTRKLPAQDSPNVAALIRTDLILAAEDSLARARALPLALLFASAHVAHADSEGPAVPHRTASVEPHPAQSPGSRCFALFSFPPLLRRQRFKVKQDSKGAPP